LGYDPASKTIYIPVMSKNMIVAYSLK